MRGSYARAARSARFTRSTRSLNAVSVGAVSTGYRLCLRPSLRSNFWTLAGAADFADVAGGHAGVVESAGALYGAGLFDAGANLGRRLGGGIAAQFLEGDGWDFDVDIDAVQEGAADLAEIVLNLARGAAALAGGIAIEPAL